MTLLKRSIDTWNSIELMMLQIDSIISSGAVFAIGASHSWIDPAYAKAYLRKTLTALLKEAEHEHGFFYHFLDPRTGKRVWNSEASSIDTALLI